MSGNHLNDLSKIYLDKVYKNNTETAEADKSRWEDLGGPTPDNYSCLLYTSPSPRDRTRSRMPSSA